MNHAFGNAVRDNRKPAVAGGRRQQCLQAQAESLLKAKPIWTPRLEQGAARPEFMEKDARRELTRRF
jgi:hypothetical protein